MGCTNSLETNCFRVCLHQSQLTADFDLNKKVYKITLAHTGTNWVHYVITWSSSAGVAVYKDGGSVVGSNVPSASSNAFRKAIHNLRIGYNIDGNEMIQIQEFRIWKFALSDDEVKELLDSGNCS